jgi:peptidoglycan/xylan/chitin deacetylase (PgdA/CDA1 family)
VRTAGLVLCLLVGATAIAAADAPVDELKTLTDDPVLGNADRVDGNEAQGVVAFTFDDGPNPSTTPAVIDALEKYDVPATFFIVTRRLKHDERSRELLARELREGFDVGSHSVDHANLKQASVAKLDREIDDSLRTLAPEAGRPIGMFRPPFGAFNNRGKRRLATLGLTEVLWSVDTRDWQAKNAATLRKQVLAMILRRHGGVVLMHDVKPITAKIIGGVLDDLEAANCRRLAANRAPIVPVSLHYFLKNGTTSRPVPEGVSRRTADYRAQLPERCARRLGIAPKPL